MQIGLIDTDIERNMFVQRFTEFRVGSDGIFRGHSQMASFLIQMPGLLTESVKMIRLCLDL